MATKTEDPRIQKLNETTIYGIYHGPLLIYIGETRDLLDQRMYAHRYRANNDPAGSLHRYMRDHVDNLHEDLDVEELSGYDTEQEAIDAHAGLLNDYRAPEREDGTDLTPAELDEFERIVEKGGSCNAAAEALDLSQQTARRVGVKLGLTDGDREYTHVDWDKWDHLAGTMSDPDLAAKIGCSTGAVRRRRRQLGIEACQASLTEEEVVEIWIIHHLDPSQTRKEVAQRADCEVNRGQVGRIIREDAYAGVDKPAPVAVQAAETYEDAREAYLDGHDCVRTKPSSAIDRMGAQ